MLSKTILGELWLLLEPTIQVVIYYFVFVFIFPSKNRYGVSPIFFLICGIAHYSLFQAAVLVSAGAIRCKGNILKQIKILPLLFVAIDFKHSVRNSLILVSLFAIIYLSFYKGYSIKLILYPIIVTSLIIFAWVLSIYISTISVFLSDIRKVATISLRFLLYLTPVVFSISFIPENLHFIFYLLNPLACVFSLLHACLFNLPFPPLISYVSLLIWLSAITFYSHYYYLKKQSQFTKVI